MLAFIVVARVVFFTILIVFRFPRGASTSSTIDGKVLDVLLNHKEINVMKAPGRPLDITRSSTPIITWDETLPALHKQVKADLRSGCQFLFSCYFNFDVCS